METVEVNPAVVDIKADPSVVHVLAAGRAVVVEGHLYFVGMTKHSAEIYFYQAPSNQMKNYHYLRLIAGYQHAAAPHQEWVNALRAGDYTHDEITGFND